MTRFRLAQPPIQNAKSTDLPRVKFFAKMLDAKSVSKLSQKVREVDAESVSNLNRHVRKFAKYGAEVTAASAALLTGADAVYQNQRFGLPMAGAALKAVADLYYAVGSVGQFVYDHPVVSGLALAAYSALDKIARKHSWAPHHLARKALKWSAGLLALRTVSEFVYLNGKAGQDAAGALRQSLLEAYGAIGAVAGFVRENPAVAFIAVAAYAALRPAHRWWKSMKARPAQAPAASAPVGASGPAVGATSEQPSE